MRGFVLYAASCVVAVALLGAIAWGFLDDPARRVQMVAFAVARLLQRRNLMLGWGLGSVLRMVALGGYALLVARVWQAPLAPALLSFVGFLFVTTVFEPVFLKQ